MSPLPALQAQGLCVRYAGKAVLQDFALDLHAGEMLVLVGPNGSGKSTALRALAGVQALSSGQIHLQQRAFDRWPAAERAQYLAYLPQDFRSQWDLQVEELLQLGARRNPGQLGQALPQALIDSLDIGHLLQRRLSQLSGGERARAGIGWALAADSPLLLADEPTAALDIAHQLHLMNYLRSRLDHCAQLLVLHDLGLALRFADRIAVLAEGRLLGQGCPQTVRQAGWLEQAFGLTFIWQDSPHGPYPIPLGTTHP